MNVALGLDLCKMLQADACNIHHVAIMHSLSSDNLFRNAGTLRTLQDLLRNCRPKQHGDMS